MIRVADTSNWGAPYDRYIFDWSKIQPERLGGGTLAGPSPLGLGQETIPETEIIGQCDFASGDAVRQIQQQLGVPVTGEFDEATCAAWSEEFGEPPTARSLEAAIDAKCATIVVPRCASVDRKAELPGWLLPAALGVAAVAAVTLSRRKR